MYQADIRVQDKTTGARGTVIDLGAAHDPRVRVRWDDTQRITRTEVKSLWLVERSVYVPCD